MTSMCDILPFRQTAMRRVLDDVEAGIAEIVREIAAARDAVDERRIARERVIAGEGEPR